MLPRSPFLYPIIDSKFSPNIVQDAREALRAGARIVQVRAKDFSKRNLYDLVKDLSAEFAEASAFLIVNDAVDIALVADCGVHLGQTDLSPQLCRPFLSDQVIGYSTHNIAQVVVANDLLVDYIAIGPIYPTQTKLDSSPPVGVELLKRIRETTRRPLVAIGGIQSPHFKDLVACRVDGIALISEIYRGGSVYDRISRLLEVLQDSTTPD